jgi:hypothetical protein
MREDGLMRHKSSSTCGGNQRAFDAGNRVPADPDRAVFKADLNASIAVHPASLARDIRLPDQQSFALDHRGHAPVAASAYGIFRNAVGRRKGANFNLGGHLVFVEPKYIETCHLEGVKALQSPPCPG